jgi:endonuclease YncB( thermonuclease family)
VFLDEAGGKKEELSEKLVRTGFCRIYTRGANLPDGRREKEFEQHLKALEREAKARKRGAWRF